jgi:large subunit ribosomal protein L9
MPNGPIKHTGEHIASVAAHSDVVVDVTGAVIGETD